ncbi:MAG: amidohydrolase family protein [bacterium]
MTDMITRMGDDESSVARPAHPSRVRMAWLVVLLLVVVGGDSDAQDRPTLAKRVLPYVLVNEPLVALTHVRIIDGTGQPARDDQTLIIQGTRITAVGAAGTVAVPAAARVLDLTGQTVIPGLVGMHEHTYFQTRSRLTPMSVSAPRLYLANGVTTIRTAGGFFPYNEMNMQRAIARGDQAGPRMHITGPYLNGGTGSILSLDRHLENAAEVRRVIAYWADEGATWLKFMANISRDLLAVGIAEAHKHGMKVTGHLCSVTFREAAALGIDNLEHGFITDSDLVPGKQPDVCPTDNMKVQVGVDVEGPAVRESIAELVAHGVAVTSTQSVYELFVPGRARLDPRALAALAPDERRAVESSFAALGTDSAEANLPLELFQKMQRYDHEFVRAGGLLVAGADPWGNGSLPGYADLRNFELFVESGFTAEQAIQIMSANGAKLLGEFAQRGSIEVGKVADLAVVRGNPVRTPADIYNMSIVFRDGIGYDSAKLIESVKGRVGMW